MHSTRAIGLATCALGAALSFWGVLRLLYGRYGAGRALDLRDYWPLWIFPALLCAGVYLALRPGHDIRPRTDLRPHDAQWSEARPRHPYSERFVLAALLAVVCALFIVPATLHYLLADRTARSPGGIALAALALVPAVLTGIWAARRGLVLLRVRDARLLINTRTIVPGQEIHVKFVQQYLQRTHVDRARVGLVCTRAPPRSDRPDRGHTGGSTNCAFEAWKDLPVELDVSGGKRLRVSGTFRLPATVQPTSTPDDAARCDWRFVLRMQLAHGPAYEAEFPVLVSPAHRSAMAEAGHFGEY
jgi:hypothetical protein